VVLLGFSIFAVLRESALDPRFSPRHRIRLAEADHPSGTPPEADDASRTSLRIAIAPVISPEKSLSLYKEFVEYLADTLDRQPVFLQRETYAEVNDLIRYRRCDMALICTYAFVRGEREFGMEILAVPVINGSVTYHSLVLVPGSSPAGGLLDLRGTRFASADIMSNSGWLYPATWLRERGIDADRFFSKHVITGSHDRSISAVAAEYVDGAAVDSIVYDFMSARDPSLTETTRVILKSPPFGMPPIVVHPMLEPELKRQLREALLTMNQNPSGQALLSILGIDRFDVPDDGLYDTVRESASELEGRS
jgi:phosphonate transport system substrate-binding protein